MSSIVVAGNTSGSITLAAPDVAGTTTLTLPATSGTVLTTASTDTANALNAGIGVNQTWQSVTRANSTTYTNSTGKPIVFVALIAVFGAGTFILNLNGVVFTAITNPSGTSSQLSVIIPNGNTYSFKGTAVNTFFELR